MILATILFLLYAASAWAMLRSVKNPRLEPIAWFLILVAIIGHSDAIMRMMRLNGRFSIGLLEAMSLLGWMGLRYRGLRHCGICYGVARKVSGCRQGNALRPISNR